MPDHHTLIVGAGFAGIGAAIALDIPSFSYQFSFEQSPNWSRTYAPGHELRAYAEHCVDKYGLRDRIRFGTEVLGATFDEGANQWRLRLDSGDELTSRFLINATGVLTVPNMPDIPGVDSFAGTTMHTARWDAGVDLRDKRVAVIGTGASAVQVIPAIAPLVERLDVFQRTPIWCSRSSTCRCRERCAARCGCRAEKPCSGC